MTLKYIGKCRKDNMNLIQLQTLIMVELKNMDIPKGKIAAPVK